MNKGNDLIKTAKRLNRECGLDDDSIWAIDYYDAINPAWWYVLYGEYAPVSGKDVIKRRLSLDRVRRVLTVRDYAQYCAEKRRDINTYGNAISISRKRFYKWSDGYYRNRKKANNG